MSTRYKIHDQNALYFLTLTTVGWIDVFTRKECRDILLESLRYCQKHKGLVLNAYVIMSNHVHLIASAQEPHELSNILRDFKKYTAKQIKRHIEQSPKESRREWLLQLLQWYAKRTAGKKEFTLWQADNHPIELYSPTVIEQKLAYLHNNPVEAGWVERPEHYLYSSASNYYLGQGLLEVEVIDPLSDIGYLFMG
ncbi:MAG: transposase [Bacteroidota bacterium]